MSKTFNILSLDRIKINQEISSKKQALEFVSHLFSEDISFSQQSILNSILNREKMGITTINNGIAIPHGFLPKLVHPLIAFVKLKQGVNFDAEDNQLTNIIISVLIPEEKKYKNLEIISNLAHFFEQKNNIDLINKPMDETSILNILKQNM